MASVTESVDVDVPIGPVYNQWTQFQDFPKFLSFVESITQQDDTHNHWKVKIGGVEREFDAEITEQHVEERVAWRSLAADTEHAGVVTFHKLSPTTTRVTAQIDWEPGSFAEKAGAALGVDDFAIKRDMQHFKEFIESQGGSETGAWRGDVPRD